MDTREDEDDKQQEIMDKDKVDDSPADMDKPISKSSLSEDNVQVSNTLSLIAAAKHAVL